MNLYTVVTGEIREGDLCSPAGPLVPVPSELIGKDAKVFSYFPNGAQIPIFRPVKVPSEEEMLQAVVNHCQKEIDCENCHSERECYQCYYKTMLRLMGIQEVEG